MQQQRFSLISEMTKSQGSEVSREKMYSFDNATVDARVNVFQVSYIKPTRLNVGGGTLQNIWLVFVCRRDICDLG